jgi:glycosyltransferase involved in cell wall biosynthesis
VVTATRPFVSFLTTAYRTEDLIGETIESVLAQTRDDWELVVVDNGNSDEMARVVGAYTADPRITLIRKVNEGIRSGVTAAAAVATGRYLSVLNSDDILHPEFCARMGALVEAEPHIDAVGCDAELFHDPDDGTPPRGWYDTIGWRSVPPPSERVTLTEMLDDGVPQYVGVFRRERWDAHGSNDPAVVDVEPDLDLWLRLAAARDDIRMLPDRLVRIRVHPNSESNNAAGIEAFEQRYVQTFLAVAGYYPISESAVAAGRVVRRLRYRQAMRRSRAALMQDDVAAARIAASEALRQRPTLRAAAVVAALSVSPGTLQALRPAKNRLQKAVARRGRRPVDSSLR